MKNHTKQFHEYLTDKTLDGIVSALSTVSNLSYGTIDKLSETASAIKDALVLGNAEGLRVFLWEIKDATTALAKSNKSKP